MTDRNALRELRPKIPTIIEQEQTSTAEQFQNRCLRPVLKMQHELLLAIYRRYIEKRKNQYHQLPPVKRPKYIARSIQQDLKLRNLLVGVILGHFTLEEYQEYLTEEKELRRRLTDLLVRRLQDGMERSGGSEF